MMSVILYLWVILQLYHYDSRVPLKNLNTQILSSFKTFRLSSLTRVYAYIKEKETSVCIQGTGEKTLKIEK